MGGEKPKDLISGHLGKEPSSLPLLKMQNLCLPILFRMLAGLCTPPSPDGCTKHPMDHMEDTVPLSTRESPQPHSLPRSTGCPTQPPPHCLCWPSCSRKDNIPLREALLVLISFLQNTTHRGRATPASPRPGMSLAQSILLEGRSAGC